MKGICHTSRTRVVHCSLLFATLLVVGQLINLSVIQRETLSTYADRQHQLTTALEARRGNIYDRHLTQLATSLKSPSIYAVPRDIAPAARSQLVRQLADILQRSPAFIEGRLSRDKAFVWLKRRVSEKETDEIIKLGSPHVSIMYEYRRFYPYRELAGQTLGFCNIDNQGLEGLERQYDTSLVGKRGTRETRRDGSGRRIAAFDERVVPPVDGKQLVLTLDRFIQYVTERELATACERWHAPGGTAIVMDPQNGEVLALAVYPAFDPNQAFRVEPAVRRNRAITDVYEPGSAFKIVTASMALNEKHMSLTDTVHCGNGTYRLGRHILHDVHPYGELTFPQVFIRSSNIGTVKIAEKLGPELLYQYVQRFGFSRITGIDLPGEVGGLTRPPSEWSKLSLGAIPIGQEVTVTPLQIVTAFAALANGGELVTPHLVREVRDAQGVTLTRTPRAIRQRAISVETASVMQEILEGVVVEGTGKRAHIPGYRIGGKTGTAQKVLPSGKGYSHSDFMSSFIGFAPVPDPALVMLVVLDNPKPSYYGGTVAAPVVRAVFEEVLPYVGILPGGKRIPNGARRASTPPQQNLTPGILGMFRSAD